MNVAMKTDTTVDINTKSDTDTYGIKGTYRKVTIDADT